MFPAVTAAVFWHAAVHWRDCYWLQVKHLYGCPNQDPAIGCTLMYSEQLWAAVTFSCHGNKHWAIWLWFCVCTLCKDILCDYLKPSGHYTYRTVVTICTAQWSLYVSHNGHYTVHWSLNVPHSGHYMYRQFNIQQFYVLRTQCIYVFCVDLRTNSDYFPIQH